VPAWWGEYQADQSVFRNLKKFGDYLYLPTAGSRYDNGGWLSNRGYSGQYWSSKSSGSNGNDMEFSRDNETVKIHVSIRTFGLSVRCVQAE
jgi:uncharacterized protein (TIGR02145 family)